MSSIYNFDKQISREGTDSVKYDLRKDIFGTQNVIPMWVADMDFATPDFILDAIRQRADKEILGYSYRGEMLMKAIREWLIKRHNWTTKTDWYLFTPGVVPALNLAVLAYTQPGDEVIVQPPVYFPFYSAVKDHGRKLICNPLKIEQGKYFFDLEDLKNKINKKTKLLILCSPHNPVGRVWHKEELVELMNICLENNILVVSDEIHSDLVFEPNKHIPLASVSEEISDHCITFMAPSKTFNTAGLFTSEVIIKDEKLRQQFSKQIDALHIGWCNVFGNVALQSAYEMGESWLTQMLNYVSNNISYTYKYLEENLPDISFQRPEATYLLWLNFQKTKMDDDEIWKMLINDAGVGLNKGLQFGKEGKGYMRMNVACPRDTLENALNNISNTLKLEQDANNLL
ncbi:MAG: cystathionine beta-lyase [Marinilabiliales bacterium]|nr:MAG: cystathionine beta-lyase [Marinilabiliales bacterium]